MFFSSPIFSQNSQLILPELSFLNRRIRKVMIHSDLIPMNPLKGHVETYDCDYCGVQFHAWDKAQEHKSECPTLKALR